MTKSDKKSIDFKLLDASLTDADSEKMLKAVLKRDKYLDNYFKADDKEHELILDALFDEDLSELDALFKEKEQLDELFKEDAEILDELFNLDD